jgi:type II secretory ATPase GspE/PulE/Tfp pilus assembly ATPase PilB-like protein
MVTPLPNPRLIEPRLAPRFHALLRLHPFPEDEPRTDERAEALMADAVQWQASDIHIEPGSQETRLRLRVDGLIYDVAAVPNDAGLHLASFFKTLSGIDATTLSQPEHGYGSMEAAGTRLELRTTAAPTPVGEMVGVRIVDTGRAVLKLDDLGIPEADQSRLRTWPDGMQGLLLVCGPVSSGKTTTLYALLHQLQTLPRSIVTVEDPVERHLDGITQIEVNPKRGLTFPEAVRAMLRLDPDFLLVGEIRDPESAHVAVTAAGSGLAVMSTIHARDAVGAVTTLRNNGVKNWEISNALEMCLSQRLVRCLCRQCRIKAAPNDEERQWFSGAGLSPPESLCHPKGCDACAGTGFDGQIGLFEFWQVDDAARKLILQGADHLALHEHALDHGLSPLSHDATEKVRAGLVSLAEVRALGGIARPPGTASR